MRAVPGTTIALLGLVCLAQPRGAVTAEPQLFAENQLAQQRVKFIQRYRSYVINYNLGEDMVRRYIEKRSGADPQKRWSEFAELLSSPRLPSGLRKTFSRDD
jgi:hypothetical protein